MSVLVVSFQGAYLLGVPLLGVSSRGKTLYECPLVDYLSMSVRPKSFLSKSVLAWSVQSWKNVLRLSVLGVSLPVVSFYECFAWSVSVSINPWN